MPDLNTFSSPFSIGLIVVRTAEASPLLSPSSASAALALLLLLGVEEVGNSAFPREEKKRRRMQ